MMAKTMSMSAYRMVKGDQRSLICTLVKVSCETLKPGTIYQVDYLENMILQTKKKRRI